MIINHRKPSLNQSIFRPSPSPSPFNSHILVLIALIVYFAHLVQILSRQQISLPTKYNTPSRNQDTTFNRNTRYIRLLILLQVLLLPQRAIILKNIIHSLTPPPPIAFNLLYHLTNLLQNIHYPCFSISMPFTQPGSSPSAAFDTYNDINQAIIAPHGNVNGRYFSFNSPSTPADEW